MTETITRIRWQDDDPYGGIRGSLIGYVDGLAAQTFTIYPPSSHTRQWTLSSYYPVALGKHRYADDPDELKAEAERWLEEFVSSLGAVFKPEPVKSRAWHADWAEVDRDRDGNAILRHKPCGGRYKILPVEEC